MYHASVVTMITAIDLEGVLIPEVWVEIANALDIPGLRVTTRDVTDFTTLMETRINLLKEHKLKLEDLTAISEKVEPYPGAVEFLEWARGNGPVMIISDTFHELSTPIINKLGHYNLFANKFILTQDHSIVGCNYRIKGQKDAIVKAFKDIGFFIIAIGDSNNDVEMFKYSSFPIMYKPNADLIEQFPRYQRASGFEELQAVIHDVLHRHAFY